MSHPMIDSSDPLVADLLAGTIELTREAGGYVAPSTVFIERAGQLSIESSAPDGEPLLRIPRAAFVRVDGVAFCADGDRIVIIASKGGAPDHPGWYKNLLAHPEVKVQILARKFTAKARTATGSPPSARPLSFRESTACRSRTASAAS